MSWFRKDPPPPPPPSNKDRAEGAGLLLLAALAVGGTIAIGELGYRTTKKVIRVAKATPGKIYSMAANVVANASAIAAEAKERASAKIAQFRKTETETETEAGGEEKAA